VSKDGKTRPIIPPLAVKGWRDNPVFKNIKKITSGDLEDGTGEIQRLKYPPWDGRNNDDDKIPDEKIGYGKYADKKYGELKEENPRYFSWMTENVPRFRLKAARLGLVD